MIESETKGASFFPLIAGKYCAVAYQANISCTSLSSLSGMSILQTYPLSFITLSKDKGSFVVCESGQSYMNFTAFNNFKYLRHESMVHCISFSSTSSKLKVEREYFRWQFSNSFFS